LKKLHGITAMIELKVLIRVHPALAGFWRPGLTIAS